MARDARLAVDLLGVYRTAGELRWDADHRGHDARAELRLGRRRHVRVGGRLYDIGEFVAQPQAAAVLGCLLLVAIFGGMFVVPLYAFLTTTVAKDQTARTVAANNVVNSGAMTIGSVTVAGIMAAGVTAMQLLIVVAGMCLVAAWIAQKLHRACDGVDCGPQRA